MKKWMLAVTTVMSLSCGIPGLETQAQEAVARPMPCETDARHAEFDFWVGQWDVFLADGSKAGSNTISKTESGCLLVEHWTGARGSTGTSMNYFDTVVAQWVQVWVSGDRTIIDIRGGLHEGSMLLVGSIKDEANPAGAAFRGTWTLLEDGRVRQFFEQSTDVGATWTPWFEGFYVRPR
ncbi:MAG: hypothetical protein MUP90_04905 [Gammaproteobacteria bacterium]|nr:hypothetical protein [Gammaproteobacteria bacterium]